MSWNPFSRLCAFIKIISFLNATLEDVELPGGLQCPTAADETFLVKTLEHMHADPGSIVLHRLVGSRLDILSFADSSLNNGHEDAGRL